MGLPVSHDSPAHMLMHLSDQIQHVVVNLACLQGLIDTPRKSHLWGICEGVFREVRS